MTSTQLLNQAQELEDQAQALAQAALFGDLFSTSPDAIDELRAQAQELRAQAQAQEPAQEEVA
jgi:hypothetical protein